MEEVVVQRNSKKWERRKCILKTVFITSIILLLIGVGIGLYLLNKTEICDTAGCKKTANLIISRMDPSVDPCDNFYDFACGNFIKTTEIPENQFSVNSFSTISEEVMKQLKEVLESPANSSEPRSFGLAKHYYKTCMDESKIEADNLTTIKTILKNVGGWPILEGSNWNESNFDWKQMSYKLNKLGFDIFFFFKINIEFDSKNNTKYILQVTQPEHNYSGDLMLVNENDLIYKYYFNLIVDIAVYFGAKRTEAEKDALDIINFHKSLVLICLSRVEVRNSMKEYNAITIEEMERKYPSIPWLEYLNNVLYPTTQIKKEEIIINQTPRYIQQLQQILTSNSSKRAMANYMLWTIVKEALPTFPKKVRSIGLKFESAAIGVTKEKDRSTNCVIATHKYFGLVTGALYIRKYFNPEAKTKGVELIQSLKETFVTSILQKNNWMDNITKERAIEKANAMTVHIGYPDQLLDDKILDNFHEKLKLNDNFLECNLLVNIFISDFSISRLRRPINESDWVVIGMITASVNAFYMFNRNTIGFPAGILQDIFFSKDRPSYVNFGSIGYIIGHEITHGFDDQGRGFDKTGNLVNWWTNKSEDQFFSKASQFITQYNNFSIPGLNNLTVKGDVTVGENIADNGGAKTAYLAYVSQEKDEPLLPGLTRFTPRQLLWISMASTWCSVDRPDYLQMILNVDTHAPARFRVIGPLTNSDEFAKDFKCRVGSKMNPKCKQQLW